VHDRKVFHQDVLTITGQSRYNLGATRESKKCYRKGIGVLKEIRLGSINKEGLLKNKLPKGDLRRVVAELLRSIPFIVRRKSILLLLSFYRPYSISFYSLE